MRVALVHRRFRLDGSLSRDAVFLARALTAAGVEVHCYGDSSQLDADLGGAVFHDVTPLARGHSRLVAGIERASFALRATRAIRRDRQHYDVVHVCSTEAWEHDVLTVHQAIVADQRRWPQQAGKGYRAARVRAALAPVLRPGLGADRVVQSLQFRPGRYMRVIAVTEDVRDDLVATFAVPPELITVIPYYVDVSEFAKLVPNGLRGTIGLAPDAPLVLFVGHDFGRKGLEDAVRALPSLGGAHLVVVGDGNAVDYRRRAAELGVSDRLHFVGATNEAKGWYAEADVLVLPTRHDPWGIVIIEAMAAGVPVVTTATAGASRFLMDAGAGIIVPERSPDAIATAVQTLLADPTYCRDVGSRGRDAAAQYGNKAYAAPVLAVYGEVVRVRASSAAKEGGS